MKRTLKKLISIIVTLSLVFPCIPMAYAEKDELVTDIVSLREKFKKDREEVNKSISYTRPNATFADAANWTTTENALRREHGYQRRVGY